MNIWQQIANKYTMKQQAEKSTKMEKPKKTDIVIAWHNSHH